MTLGTLLCPLITFTLVLIALTNQADAEPVIHRIEPLGLTIGQTTTITVFGDRLTQDGMEPILWSNASITWKLLEPEDPKQDRYNPRELRFAVTVNDQSPSGVRVIRIANRDGISAPSMLLLDTEPAVKTLRLESSQPATESFTAKAGQTYYCEAWSRRLNQDTDLIMTIRNESGDVVASADDDEVIGFDPQIQFIAPATGTYTIEVHDNQWRGDSLCCVRIGPKPLMSFESTTSKFVTEQAASPIPLQLEANEYLTVTPRTRAIGSAAMLLLELHDDKGRRVAQTGTAETADEPLRFKSDQAGSYQLLAQDLVQRSGLPFDLSISTDQAPFAVQLDGGSRDRHALKAADEFKIRFRVTRFRYDGPITIECPDLELQDNLIPEKRNDIEAKLKVGSSAAPDSLLTFRFQATAVIDGKPYSTPVRTTQQFKRDAKHVTQQPAESDGTCFVFIKPDGGKK